MFSNWANRKHTKKNTQKKGVQPKKKEGILVARQKLPFAGKCGAPAVYTNKRRRGPAPGFPVIISETGTAVIETLEEAE